MPSSTRHQRGHNDPRFGLKVFGQGLSTQIRKTRIPVSHFYREGGRLFQAPAIDSSVVEEPNQSTVSL